MAQFNTTELDFDNIKQNLVDYFKRESGPFKDWDFEGSGLSHLLDVLAYNTHYNAVTAHMAMNESFLDSAQVRSNIVSRAKLLGYTPSSTVGATARVDIVLNRAAGNSETQYTLEKGTKLSTKIDNVTYKFRVEETQVVNLNNLNVDNTFTFQNVLIKQGAQKSQQYLVDNTTDQKFIIPDKNVDTSTLQVKVYDNINGDTFSTYTKFTDFNNISNNSAIYFLYENTQQQYEVQFGNDVLGRRPPTSGKVVLEYLTTKGSEPNGARSFSWAETGDGEVTEQSVTTVSAAAGGAERESSDSIKFNAPLGYISQNRAVTSNDYKTLITQNISGLKDVIAWGGEKEDNPVFGKVYISCKPSGADFLTASQKNDIINFLNGKRIVTIEPVVVDPTYTYLYFNINYRYNSNITDLSEGEISERIRQTIIRYNEEKLNQFDGIFRHSQFLQEIDKTDPSIVSTNADVLVYKRATITPSAVDFPEVNFNLAFDGQVDQTQSIISSSTFLVNNQLVSLADERIAGDREKRNIYTFYIDNVGNVVRQINNVGYVFPATGKVTLSNVNPDVTTNIFIYAQSKDDDVLTDRRNILQIDLNNSNLNGTKDNRISTPSSGRTGTTTAGSGVSLSGTGSSVSSTTYDGGGTTTPTDGGY